MKRAIILLASFWVLSFSAFSQKTGQTVRGTVIDATTGNPLLGATIIVVESNPIKGTTTNDNGEFEITGVTYGRWSFTASFIGYGTKTIQNIMVTSGKQPILTFKLEEKATTLKDVVVRAKIEKEKPLNDMAVISARSFSVEETERFAGSLGDPARMVANYAGVMPGNDSRNDIVIRGNSPMGVLWRIDGVEVPNPNHFGAQGTTGGPVSMLNSNLLTNSDFITSAFPAEYGNALSGVFDINLRSGNREKYEFTGQVGFNGFEAAIEGPIPMGKNRQKGSFIADYRYSTLQLVSNMGMNIGAGTAIPEYQDLSVIVDLPTKKAGKFKFIQLYGNSFISMGRSFSGEGSTNYNQSGYATDFGALLNVTALTHTIMLSEKTRINSSISFQRSSSNTKLDSIDLLNKTYFPWYTGSLLEDKLTASIKYKHKFNAKNNITLGASSNTYLTSFNDSVYMREYHKRIEVTNQDQRTTTLYKGYANWQHKFSDFVTLNTGIYTQFYDLNNESSVEPRIGFQWQLTQRQTISFGYGMHSQIQPRTAYFNKQYDQTTNSYSENNLNMKFTRSHHIVLGYDLLAGQDFRIKLEAYHQILYNVPVSRVTEEFSMLNYGSGFYLPSLDSLVNNGNGQNSGVELTIEKFLTKGYYGLVTLSVFDSKYQAFDKKWRSTSFNTNFAANILAGYEWKIGKKSFLTLDARTVWSGGKRYTPIDLAASIATNEEKYDWTKTNDKKYSDYFRCDLRIGFKQNYGKFSQEWGLDLQNITGHKNIFNESFNTLTHEINTVYQQGFIPMMLYRVNF